MDSPAPHNERLWPAEPTPTHEQLAHDIAPTSAGKAHTPSDVTRDHLANERTLLAWARTAVALMALGFVVARFGLVLRGLGPLLVHHPPTGVSTAFGVALVIAGAALTILSTVRYLQAGRAIDGRAYQWSPVLGLALTLLLVLVAGLLAVYLVWTA
jgi:putative membrane protein